MLRIVVPILCSLGVFCAARPAHADSPIPAATLRMRGPHASSISPVTGGPRSRCQLGEPGCVTSADGAAVREDQAYAALTWRGRPHYLRAGIELTVLLGAGYIRYWFDPAIVNNFDTTSWKQRFTLEAWRFDNNPFGINFVWHAVSGTAYHLLPRTNELGLLGSIGFGFATSMAWEFLLEFKEKVSVNDVVTTTASGVAIGEFMHWLGRYVNSEPARDHWAYTTARWTLGLALAAHDRDHGRRRWSRAPPDSLGLRTDIWHRFEVAYGFAMADVSVTHDDAVGGDRAEANLHQLRVYGRLVALPGYLRPGRSSRLFADGNVSSLALDMNWTGDGYGVGFRSDATLLGLYHQNIASSPRGRGAGHAAMVGAALAYEYRREGYPSWDDRLALVHLPGLAIDADVLGERWALHAELRAHGDFAGIDAMAHHRWVAAHPDEVGKTILRKQGYYFGWGWSARASAELTLPYVSLGGAIFHGRYRSQEGLDRTQENLTIDPELADTVLEYDAWLRVAPPSSGLFAELRLSHQGRRATQDGLRGEQRLDRVQLGVGAAF